MQDPSASRESLWLGGGWEDVCSVWGYPLHQLVGMSWQGQDATGIQKRPSDSLKGAREVPDTGEGRAES